MNYTQVIVVVEPLIVGREILIAELAELGFESFVDTETGFEAYIPESEFKKKEFEAIPLLADKEFTISYQITSIEQQNWNQQWEESFEPIEVESRLLIRAPFHQAPPKNVLDIIIEPKMSFGTGHHETTYLIAKRLLDLSLENKSILDMGCGTGILAILAKKKKCGNILAIDNDEWAYTNCLENCQRNHVDIEVVLGDAHDIKNNKFDVIIANINRNILLRDMHIYADALNDKGLLLLSGFFMVDKNILMEQAQKLGLKLHFEATKNEWAMLELIKN
jgi:ribosomal protein L11 methyltransferase